MNYVVEPQAVTSIPVVGGDQQFPVRRVYCVGCNVAGLGELHVRVV